jgi:dCTP deaminase
MMLSKTEIEHYIKSGDITIDPFVPENLGSAQYDVTLGEWLYRERRRLIRGEAFEPSVYNPFDERCVRAKWDLDRAITHEDWIERSGVPLENIGRAEKLILLAPGEIILGHTNEFIGGSCDFITTMMKARSSLGRNCVEVCRCAGMGDVGYFNRWTMEIVNTSSVDTIVLPVGRRVAQLLFFKVKPVEGKDVYDQSGKYQASKSLAELKEQWTPAQMLPKQWLDRESRAARGESVQTQAQASYEQIYAQVKRSVEWLMPQSPALRSRDRLIDYCCKLIPRASREMVYRAVDEITAKAKGE